MSMTTSVTKSLMNITKCTHSYTNATRPQRQHYQQYEMLKTGRYIASLSHTILCTQETAESKEYRNNICITHYRCPSNIYRKTYNFHVHHIFKSRLKSRNLVPAKGRWCSEAGKVTVGLASHWPCVTEFSGLSSPPMVSKAMRGRWAPHLRPGGAWSTWPFLLLNDWKGMEGIPPSQLRKISVYCKNNDDLLYTLLMTAQPSLE